MVDRPCHLYKDGSIYIGQFIAGTEVRHGKGKLVKVDGSVYKGDWRDNKRHGTGKETLPNGQVYKGDWRSNLYSGKGKLIYYDGRCYKG